jgi:hypothetical protein
MSLAILLLMVYLKLASWGRCNLSYKDTNIDTILPNFWKSRIHIRCENGEKNLRIFL